MVLIPILAASLLAKPQALRLQEAPSKVYQVAASDVSSPDSIIRSLYEVISGPAGARNWDRMRSLFDPKAIMGAIYKNRSSEIKHLTFTVDDYIRMDTPYFDKNGFFEHESSHKMERYDRIAEVFSTYESRHNANDPKAFETGINSIQLVQDGGRWYIFSILWQGDDSGVPVPKRYR